MERCVRIEMTPGKIKGTRKPAYTATLKSDHGTMAEIKNAPLDIANRWADVMKELHDGEPEIKMVGVCIYCGSTERNGVYCGGCERVFRG